MDKRTIAIFWTGLILMGILFACHAPRAIQTPVPSSAQAKQGRTDSLRLIAALKDSLRSMDEQKASKLQAPVPVYHIALLCPLYLDSVMDHQGLYIKQRLPAYLVPGLEFFEGSRLALDSLAALGFHLDVQVLDTKADSPSLSEILQGPSLDSADLVIGFFTYGELRLLASYCLEHHKILVSATLPNDAQVRENPYLVIVNATLQAHCNALLKYALTNFNQIHLVLFRQNNPREDLIASELEQAYRLNGGPAIVPLQQAFYDTSFRPQDLARSLDSTRNNICLFATLNRQAALAVCRKLAALTPEYQIQVMGMPTWDDIPGLFQPGALGDLPVFYSTPYYNLKQDTVSHYIEDYFARRYELPFPSDMAFRGFDITWYFIHLFGSYGDHLTSFLNDPGAQIMTRYNFQAVHLGNSGSGPDYPDYYENLHLYFVKILNGVAYPAGSE